MTAVLQQKILEALQAMPNQKADELARQLGCSRTDVNKILYGPLKHQVTQNSSYRWSFVKGAAERKTSDQEDPSTQFANTDLAKLCRYYLACLGYDDTGISTFLTSKYGDPDYIELKSIPRSSEDLAESGASQKLLGRKRTERGRYGLYFGYPTSVSHIKSRRSDWEGFMVEPILLFPIEQESGNGRLIIDFSFPIINQKPFQSFTNVEREMLMNELVQLEHELGIGANNEQAEIDEIAMRLQSVRPEWPWKEDIDPGALGDQRTPMTEINEAGIYNRAVILMAEKSPFTQGLEKELRDLAQLPASAYANTALGHWLLKKESSPEQMASLPAPLLEVLPMNSEQRQAVVSALTRPVTIITGPPGTGKSQVVTNLLINAAWSGKRVLFASKNNKAVDVVETRVNAIGSRPILLRLGSQVYQARLAEYVLALLSSTTSASEKEEFAELKKLHERLLEEHSRLSRETQNFIQLRNDIDRLEQLAEEARQYLGQDMFTRALDLDVPEIRKAVLELSDLAAKADREQASALVKILWPLFKKARIAALGEAVKRLAPTISKIGISSPNEPKQDADIPPIRETAHKATINFSALEKVVDYRRKLRELQAARPLEVIAREDATLLGRIARHSEMLWKLWLRIQPSLLSTADRQKLGKYTSLIKMVMEAGNEGQLSDQVYKQYNAMLREVSHLLSCWAVTSLSTRGRIPFKAGIFDLVIFDEASQCDIASALPLLYRAKAVVVIGDPKQLSHISGLQRGQDQALLERFGLMEDFPHWAYSHQSLFDLGSTHVSGEDIVSLVDHHRSHADIINFSNDEFYEERLRVATKYDRLKSPNRSEPGIRWVDVKGRTVRPSNGGACNNQEVKAVVNTLHDLVLEKGYDGSIGVVTPFRAQARLIIEAITQNEKLSAALIRRGFLVDTVHKFQGDERDVMIFSPVVSQELPAGAAGFLRSNGNLFNVAITRARAQLIVVGDMTACASSDIGYLSRFAVYTASLKDPLDEGIEIQSNDLGSDYPNVANPDIVSDWEKIFYIAGYKAGFHLIPQYSIEKYIVDFLMVAGKRKLAIEIDGEKYHRNWNGELCRRDQLRNQRLFELGYDVIRFWVYEVRDDVNGCLKRLEQWQKS